MDEIKQAQKRLLEIKNVNGLMPASQRRRVMIALKFEGIL